MNNTKLQESTQSMMKAREVVDCACRVHWDGKNGNSKTQVVEDLQSLQEPIPKAMVHGVLTSLSTVKPRRKCNYISVPYVFCYYSLLVLLWNLCWLSVESLTFHLMPPLATSSKGWVALTWLYLPLLFLLLLLLLFLHQTSAICTLFETVGSSQEFSMNDPFEPQFDCNSSAFFVGMTEGATGLAVGCHTC